MIRDSGAIQVHMRVASPPIISTCHFGVDTGKTSELIAANNSLEEIKESIGADSLEFLSIEGLKRSIDFKDNYCMGCFSKEYPMPVQLEIDKMRLEKIRNG